MKNTKCLGVCFELKSKLTFGVCAREFSGDDGQKLCPLTDTQTFSLLLSIIYNPRYNLYDGYTRHDWFNILYVAVSWEFEEIQRLAMQQIQIIDNHLEGQQENIQLTRRFPSPMDTEPIPDLENEYDNMYVDESQ